MSNNPTTGSSNLHVTELPKLDQQLKHTHGLDRLLPELKQLEQLIQAAGQHAKVHVEEHVMAHSHKLPIYSLTLGNAAPNAPALLVIGGVHGVERIGTHVALAQLHRLIDHLQWDSHLQQQLEKVHLCFIPLLNPGGMLLNRRANPNGVDLMRNAPIEVKDDSTFLVSGQRLTRALPWFRGQENTWELENQALLKVIDRDFSQRAFSLVLDCHSGFGFRDRLWFPYAYRRAPMRHIEHIMALKLLWERSHPNHSYVFEPQSNHYLTHGDVWDYLCKQLNQGDNVFLPLTLEMGSWNWVKKRPLQALRFQGLFNPLVGHRHQRVLRRHIPLFEFLLKAAYNHQTWMPQQNEVANLKQMANTLWYHQT